MDMELIIYLELGIIGILTAALLIANGKIKKLRQHLAEEKKKRTFPLLVFSVNRDELRAYLKNESYCYAKHIQIDELDITVEYGFKKKLKLIFDPIVMLKPNQQVQLKYKVFDGEFDMTSQSPDSLVLQFHDNPFTMHLSFENLEEEKFRSTVVWEDGEYVVKDVKPLDEPPEV